MSTSEKEQKKECIALRAMANLFQKGSVINQSAEDFLNFIESMPNAPAILEISEKMKQLDNLSDDEKKLLTDIFQDVHGNNTKSSETSNVLNSAVEEKHTEIALASNCSIIDCTNDEEDIMDEYHFILNNSVPTHQFKLTFQQVVEEYSITYTNYVFGNFRIHHEDCNNFGLLKLFERDKIIQAIFETYGFISIDGKECTVKLKNKIFDLLVQLQPSLILNRNDFTRVALIKIGEIEISSPKGNEKMDQYLITDIDASNLKNTLYISYGFIDFDKANNSLEYYNDVANTLLSRKNLNDACYIGSIENSEVIRKKYDFGGAKSIVKEL